MDDVGESPRTLALSDFFFLQGWWGECAGSLNIILAVLELSFRPGWPRDFRKPSRLPHTYFLLYHEITMAGSRSFKAM